MAPHCVQRLWVGCSRRRFCELRGKFQTCGFEGLIDRLPGATGPHPNRVAAGDEAAVPDPAHAHPDRHSCELFLRLRSRRSGCVAPRLTASPRAAVPQPLVPVP